MLGFDYGALICYAVPYSLTCMLYRTTVTYFSAKEIYKRYQVSLFLAFVNTVVVWKNLI